MQIEPSSPPASVFRVSRFAVPPASMPEFMARLDRVHAMLSRMPGCTQNLLLTQAASPDGFNVMTIAEWAGAEAMASAKSAMDAHQAQEGFDPDAFRQRLGIRAESTVYTAATPYPMKARPAH